MAHTSASDLTAEIPCGLYARIVTATDGEQGHVYVFNSGTEIYNFTVPPTYSDNLDEIAIGAKMFSWRFLDEPQQVKPGQFVVRVERIPNPDA
jgi:hypothetical protein